MSPSQVWDSKKALIGKKMVRAYWCEDDPERSLFAFKTLANVVTGPHAYTRVFEDGSRDELISYDRVCVAE